MTKGGRADLDSAFRALADASRRELLDRLHERNGQTLNELCARLAMTRQAVSKHLGILEEANLVATIKRGREKFHYLNPVPIHAIAERWIGKYERHRLDALAELKKVLEWSEEKPVMNFVLHGVPGSPYGRAALMGLEEKGATYRLSPVSPDALKASAHLARHPFGRVPVLEHGDFMLYETQAILRYLDRTNPAPALTPSSPREAARMDQAMNICDWYLFSGVGDVIAFERVVKPALLGGVPDEARIAAVMPKAHAVFQELSRLLGNNQYFSGATFSLADILIASHLDFLSRTPEWSPLVRGRDNLPAWLERIGERPSFKATTWERVSELAMVA